MTDCELQEWLKGDSQDEGRAQENCGRREPQPHLEQNQPHRRREQLEGQRAKGHRYFMSDQLTALDVYWACFSNLIDPLPPEKSPMPDFIRGPYGSWDGGCPPALLALRDRVFEQHLGLPQEY